MSIGFAISFANRKHSLSTPFVSTRVFLSSANMDKKPTFLDRQEVHTLTSASRDHEESEGALHTVIATGRGEALQRSVVRGFWRSSCVVMSF
jgi:hypothetical protein